MLEVVTAAAVTTRLDTEVSVRTARSCGTEGLTALKGQVGLEIEDGTVEKTDSSATDDILVTSRVVAARSKDDGRGVRSGCWCWRLDLRASLDRCADRSGLTTRHVNRSDHRDRDGKRDRYSRS